MGSFTIFPEEEKRKRFSLLANGGGSAVDPLLQFPREPAGAPRAEADPYDEIFRSMLESYAKPDTSRLESMNSELGEMDKKPALWKRILGAAIPAAGIAIAGATGGLAGASGAAEGANLGIQRERGIREQRRNALLEDIEEERQALDSKRRFGMEQAGLRNWREGQLDIKEEANRISETQGDLRLQIQQTRANAYADNIASLVSSREGNLGARLEELEAKIGRDSQLDERYRDKLAQDLQIAKLTIAQRQREAEGRQTIEETRQDAISRRQREMIERGESAANVALNYRRAIEAAQALGYYDQMTPEQQAELVNSIAESFLSQAMPTLSAGEGAPRMGGLFGTRDAISATPGKAAASPSVPAAAPSPAQPPASHGTPQGLPAQVVSQMKVGVITTLQDPAGNITRWIKNQDGTVQQVQ